MSSTTSLASMAVLWPTDLSSTGVSASTFTPAGGILCTLTNRQHEGFFARPKTELFCP